MENYLVPFNFQIFHTTESVWDFNKKDYIKMFRMTRRGIGEFLNPESRDPQKIIDKILERNTYIRKSSLPVTVTGKTGQKFKTETYDIWGIYQICVESTLRNAKEFLRRFPAFLDALYTRIIKPPAIKNVRPEILGYIGLLHKEKKTYRQNVCKQLGWGNYKFFRECGKAGAILGIQVAQKRKIRSDAGKTKHPDLKAAAVFIKSQMPGYGPQKIFSIINQPAAYKENVKRWIKAA